MYVPDVFFKIFFSKFVFVCVGVVIVLCLLLLLFARVFDLFFLWGMRYVVVLLLCVLLCCVELCSCCVGLFVLVRVGLRFLLFAVVVLWIMFGCVIGVVLCCFVFGFGLLCCY